MAVYFIQAGEAGPVKIGTADDPTTRLRELQCGNHAVLTIIRTTEGGRSHEAGAHKAFAKQRIRGEWFHFSPDMLTREIVATVRPQSRPRIHDPLIDALGGTGVLAKHFGFVQAVTSNWVARGIPWKYRTQIAQMAEAKGIALPVNFLGLEGVRAA